MSIGKTPTGQYKPLTPYCKSRNCERSSEYVSIRYAWFVLICLILVFMGLVTLMLSVNLSAYGKENKALIEQKNALIQQRMDSIKTNITVIITDPTTGAHNDYHLQ